MIVPFAMNIRHCGFALAKNNDTIQKKRWAGSLDFCCKICEIMHGDSGIILLVNVERNAWL